MGGQFSLMYMVSEGWSVLTVAQIGECINVATFPLPLLTERKFDEESQ